jgi:hypothetical protein
LRRRVLLPGEDPAEWTALAEGLEAHFDPQTAWEAVLVDQIIATTWRLRRVSGLEAAFVRAQKQDNWVVKALSTDRAGARHEPDDPDQVGLTMGLSVAALATLGRYEAHLQRLLARLVGELEGAQATHPGRRVVLDVGDRARDARSPTTSA